MNPNRPLWALHARREPTSRSSNNVKHCSMLADSVAKAPQSLVELCQVDIFQKVAYVHTTQVHPCMCVYVCMYVCMYGCMHARMYINMCMCACRCRFMCMYVCTCVCLYACMYVRTCNRYIRTWAGRHLTKTSEWPGRPAPASRLRVATPPSAASGTRDHRLRVVSCRVAAYIQSV